jgi:hypothetical protein
MKISELAELNEYNKGALGQPLQDSALTKYITQPPIGILPSIPGKTNTTIFVYYYEKDNICFYVISNQEKTEIYGYLQCEHVFEDVWQVKNAYVKCPGQGTGTELYHFVSRIGNKSAGVPIKKLINDTQLSPAAEAIWKNNLENRGLARKIYDKKLNICYNLEQVGQATLDNATILDPEMDTQDPSEDPTLGDIRFFWLIESTFRQLDIHPLRQKYLQEGMTLELSEQILESRPAISMMLITGCNIFSKPGEF